MLTPSQQLASLLEKYRPDFYPVVPFRDGVDLAARLDLTRNNRQFSEEIYQHLGSFTSFIDQTRRDASALYLYGGYGETRQMYRRSHLFDRNLFEAGGQKDEPRSLHLGLDVWGDAGTPISAPMGGVVHSLAYNDHVGDYGATIILGHQIDGFGFYSLYGHLSLKDLSTVREGHFINRGEVFAHFGPPEENGHWPPHLHFQLIIDIGVYDGDYPGVCRPSESAHYLANSPDPAPFFPFAAKNG